MPISEYKVTILSNNVVFRPDFRATNGLSMLIERKGKAPILFDTGPDYSVTLRNARLSGKDLKRADTVIFSHGHNDHTAGVYDLLNMTRKDITIYAHPDVFTGPRYSKRDAGAQEIGFSFKREDLERLGASFRLSDMPDYIGENIMTTGEIPRKWGPSFTSGLFKDQEMQVKDEIKDDIGLIFRLPKGLVLMLGCCHSGMVNTIEHSIEITGERRIFGIIGGNHMKNSPPGSLDRLAGDLLNYDFVSGGIGLNLTHCSGVESIGYLKYALLNKINVKSLNVGDSLEF